MKDALAVRLYALLLILSLLWLLLGSPILPAEWQNVPRHLTLLAHQLPQRMLGLFAYWY